MTNDKDQPCQISKNVSLINSRKLTDFKNISSSLRQIRMFITHPKTFAIALFTVDLTVFCFNNQGTDYKKKGLR